jgi:NTE family protein
VPPRSLALGAQDYHVNRRRFAWTTHRAAYLDKAANPFVHVMDGGLADNIGLRAVLRQLWEPSGFIATRFNTGKISKLIVIAVNAKNGLPPTYAAHRSPPGLADVAFKTATTAMDNYSFETIELLRDQQRSLRQAQRDVAKCKELARNPADCPSFAAPVEIHVVDVGLEAMPDLAKRQRLLAVGTNFSLTRADVQLLVDAGGELLAGNPDFQKLLATLR